MALSPEFSSAAGSRGYFTSQARLEVAATLNAIVAGNRSRLRQQVFELGEVDGFGEMVIEASFFGAAFVFVLAPTS